MKYKKRNVRWMLVVYDLLVYELSAVLLLGLYGGNDKLSISGMLQQMVLALLCVFSIRLIGNVYGQIWRYGGIQCYIRLLYTDAIAFFVYLILELVLPVEKITFARMLCLISINLLGALALRMMYRYAYKCSNQETKQGRFLASLLYTFGRVKKGNDKEVQKIKIAIIGAGRVGVSFAEDLLNSDEAAYIPRCFIDINENKVGREIQGLPVWSEDEATFRKLNEYEVQEIVFAIPSMDAEKKKTLYEYYKNAGYKLKVYDYPTVYAAGGKRHLREFDIEELLFRKPLVVSDEHTNEYYKGKVVLITGGGGSIGSELCRQLAKMQPKQIVILDIYENGAYDVQQELKIAYGNTLNLQIEICSITHKKALERVFAKYHPQIVINAAAHEQIDENGKSLNKIIKTVPKADYNRVLLDCPVGNSTVMYNVEKMGKFEVPNIRKRNDDALWLRMLKKEKYIYGMKSVLMKYRIRQNSISSNKIKVIKYHWILYRDIEHLSIARSVFHIAYWCVIKVLKIK